MLSVLVILVFFFFFFNDTATTEIYTLSLHDALPISRSHAGCRWRRDENPAVVRRHRNRERIVRVCCEQIELDAPAVVPIEHLAVRARPRRRERERAVLIREVEHHERRLRRLAARSRRAPLKRDQSVTGTRLRVEVKEV